MQITKGKPAYMPLLFGAPSDEVGGHSANIVRDQREGRRSPLSCQLNLDLAIACAEVISAGSLERLDENEPDWADCGKICGPRPRSTTYGTSLDPVGSFATALRQSVARFQSPQLEPHTVRPPAK